MTTVGRWRQVPAAPPMAPPAWRGLASALLVAAAPAIGWWVGRGAGWPVAALALWGVLLATWVDGRVRLPLLEAAGPGATAPVAVLSAVAGLGGWQGDRAWSVLVPLLLATLVPFLARLGGGAMARAAHRVGTVAGDAVAAVAFTILGLVAVVLPWSFQRLVRMDPLRTAPGWVRRGRIHAQPAQPWAPDPARDPQRSPGHAWRTAAVVLVVVGLVALSPPGRSTIDRIRSQTAEVRTPFRLEGATLGGSDLPELREPVDPDLQAFAPDRDAIPAVADQDWYQDQIYREAQGFLLDPNVGWRPINPYRMADMTSPYVNMVDGRRVSWQAPPCDCDRLTVWMYGGSTTWGLEQRDEHTIASEIARAAHADGLVVDVQNRGQLGQLHWMEAERLAWDLTTDEAPDLVVFYDGANDQWASNVLNDIGSSDIPQVLDPTLIDIWGTTGRSEGAGPAAPPGARVIGRERGEPMLQPEYARTVIDRYDRSRQISRAAADAHGIEVRYLWQPTRYSKPVNALEEHADASGENWNRLLEQMVRDELPDDVIDVSDALDDVEVPVFTDDVHHNELAARIIGEEIYRRLAADLRRLAGSGP